MRKNSHDRILRGESKKKHLSTVPKSYPVEGIGIRTIIYVCFL